MSIFYADREVGEWYWLHAARLPLGCGWSGHCTAPGHEGETPSQEELRDFCNLGYAGRLRRDCPAESAPGIPSGFGRANALSAMAQESESGTRIQVRYVCERVIVPRSTACWNSMRIEDEMCAKPHPDRRLQRMAECFLTSYLRRKKKAAGSYASCCKLKPYK